MKTKNGYDLGLWKCGKGKAFTHIPTNIIILLKKNPSYIALSKRGEKNHYHQRSLKQRPFESFSGKTFDITN